MQKAPYRRTAFLLLTFELALLPAGICRADAPYVVAQTLSSTTRNDFQGLVGFRFTNTTGEPIVITKLGRWVLPGNNKPHTLGIYTPIFAPVSVASVTVDCSGATANQFLYGALSSPYTLPIGDTCYIVSTETYGGDYFCNDVGTVLTTTALGTIISANQYAGGWIAVGGPSSSYGPVSFQVSSPLDNWTKVGNNYITDGSQYSVYSAITNSSVGDVVNIPAGTFTWGSFGIGLAHNKPVTVLGAGPALTTIKISTNAPSFGNGIINISGGGTIGNFTMTQAGGTNTTGFTTSTTDGWRITNVTYNSSATGAYYIYAASYGLVDNCTINTLVGYEEPIFARGPSNSWQTPISIGTANAVYVEDCTFNGPGYVCDINSNGRAVFRFNTITGTQKIDGHGFASNTPPRGVRQMEIYNNTWTTSSTFWTAIEIRGGTGMVFDNSAPNTVTSRFYLTDYGYQGSWPNFGGVYQTPTNYPIIDQIGVGIDPKVAGSEPFYVWNNKENGTAWPRQTAGIAPGAIARFGTTFTEQDVIQANRDFFADAGFDGSGNIGRGTKAAMLATNPATAGAGWWVTDEGSWNKTKSPNTSGQLYVWDGSAWVLKYTPYTYPHPLRPSGVPGGATIMISR